MKASETIDDKNNESKVVIISPPLDSEEPTNEIGELTPEIT